MSIVVQWVDDAVAGIPVVKDAWDLVKDVSDQVWRNVATPILEFVFKLLGIEDEDIVTVQVMSQQIIADGALDGVAMTAALELQRNDTPILSTIATTYAQIKGKYSTYDLQSDSFIDGRPDATIRARVVDNDTVKSVLDGINGHNNTLIEVVLGLPDKYIWSKYLLQVRHNYAPHTNELIYGGYTQRYQEVLYNYSTNKYEVTIARIDTVTSEVYEKTIVTVVNIDTEQDEVTTEVFTVTENTGTITGLVVEEALISTVTEVVDIDTVESSETTVLIDTIVYENVYSTDVIELEVYPSSQMYLVKYEWVIGEWYYWVYNPEDGTYPELSSYIAAAQGLDMLPIVALRLDKQNINSDTASTRYITSKKIMDSIGLDIDEFIDGIGENDSIDQISEAFISFSIRVTDDSPIVSKALYVMADTIYRDDTLNNVVSTTVGNDSFMSFTITEGQYNQMAKWSAQRRNVYTGSIGTVGTYKHRIDTIVMDDGTDANEIPLTHNGARLVIQFQSQENEYVEYQFDDITSMTWISYEGYGNMNTLSPLEEQGDNFCIPLSMYFVKQLSAKDQMELYIKTLRVSFYAIDVVHLKYYETEAFGAFLQFVAIVITVISLGSMSWVNILIAVASSYALKKVLESGAPDWLKAVAAVAYVYVNMTYGGGADTSGFQTAVTVTTFSTHVFVMGTAAKSKALGKKSDDFNRAADEREAENEAKKANIVEANFSTDSLMQLMNPVTMSPGTKYDVAKGSLMYDYSTLYKMTETSYDYDRKFDLGIV